jgi:catalase
VTQDVSAYTKAAVFQPGTKTDTLIRFSTVDGGKNNNYFLENHFKPQSGEY